jgi:hypothetical protein
MLRLARAVEELLLPGRGDYLRQLEYVPLLCARRDQDFVGQYKYSDRGRK